MMNYAPGADAPRKAHSRDTNPAPPSSAPRGAHRTSSNAEGVDDSEVSSCSCTEDQINDVKTSPPGIHYSEDGSKAARHSTGVFFTLDSKTKLPIPLDRGGFFRVRDSDLPAFNLKIEYRIERKFFKRFNAKWLSSRQVEGYHICINREIAYEDILNRALILSEERLIDTEKMKWMGDYPPKSLPVTDEVK